jgi:hypothetical protein
MLHGTSDKWVLIGSSDEITDYYDSSSIKLIKEDSCIQVTFKRVYTTKGRKMLLDFGESQNFSNDDVIDIHHSLDSYNIYYDRRKQDWFLSMYVSKSGQVLKGGGSPDSYQEPVDIKPGTIEELRLNKLIKDYNIQINDNCDDNVYVWSDEKYTLYYIKSSVKIDNQFHIIQVKVKRVYTEKGIVNWLSDCGSLDKQHYVDISYTLLLYYFDYKDWKITITNSTHYFKSGDVLSDHKHPYKFVDIIPKSIGEGFINKLLTNYNIQSP